ncbi:molybdenum cofactor biosynthesis protein B [Allobranchiibius sp. CTAmp26]|uniref:MogA/MoaB family molybdenum cofactor biosynthesis protein n=1 Tax=Allobranchiibius sp. CTAmp26 TaxID=2815214 RepID=UPI001AA0D2FA|nr:MogA/MoaB family molybdenum cofactor biosynthesis protein [Allobranchiibius sp. CTAmp26]MBO1753529.1 MogA/MoaB family molybdenum cofactor biosynthesis protein [Allobranchiibius sp. CTAmp26]
MPRALIITCSDRAFMGEYDDRSGPLLVAAVREWGFDADEAQIVPDGPPVGDALRAAVADGVDLVLTTGGTGLSPSDHTPEETAALLYRRVAGIPEALRAAGVRKGVPSAVLSRGLAGVAGRTLIVNLPGSTGGVRDAIEVLRDVVPHAVAQVHGGGDH